MSEPVYARSPDVVWRLGPGRVLVRRVGATGEHPLGTYPHAAGEITELLGPVARVWLALDDPADASELEHRLRAADAEVENLNDELSRLAEVGLVAKLG